MTTPKITINKKYSNKKAFIEVKGVIRNPQNLRQVPLTVKCRIDTGFDGGMLVPHWHLSDAKSVGVNPTVTNIVMADGRKVTAYVCVAHLQEIEANTLPAPGIPIILVMCGSRKGNLLGMDSLKAGIISFDGLAQAFTLII